MEWFQCVLSNEQTMALGIINFQLIIFYLKVEKETKRNEAHSIEMMHISILVWLAHLFSWHADDKTSKHTTHIWKRYFDTWRLFRFDIFFFLGLCFLSCRLSIRFSVPPVKWIVRCTFTHTHTWQKPQPKETIPQWTHYYFISNHL